MQNPRLAARYAKSLVDLAVERNVLEATLRDMQIINAICEQNRDFAVMLSSPIISGEKKLSVIKAVLQSQAISELSYAFIGRELNMPEIAAAFLVQYNEMKQIKTVKITTAAPMSNDVKAILEKKAAGYMPGSTINLKTAVDESLIGGFVLEVEDKLYDASVKKGLNDIRSKLIDTSYISKM
jgi:F-type H+-transporting ATPase subunit delta